MDNSSQKSQTNLNINQPTQRLKDSCDMCSASKVRCNRQKPICSRCTKLGYPCFYSPARRVGRPHGRSTTVSASRPSKTTQASTLGAKSDKRAVQRQTDDSLPETPPVQDVGMAGNYKEQYDSSNILSTSSTQASSTSAGSCNHLGLDSSPVLGNSHAMPSVGERCHKPVSNMLDPCESDCAGIAMTLQQQLEAAQESPAFLSGRDGGQMDRRSADAAMEIVGSAFRQLSTILICPCSERLEVGLLVAAACISILDVYGVIVSNLAAQPLSQSGMSASAMTMEDDDALHWNMMELSGSSSCKLFIEDFGEDVLLVRVMGELSKMATVVMQFTNRYRGGRSEEGNSEELLYAVATDLRNRLQTIKDEMTGRLL